MPNLLAGELFQAFMDACHQHTEAVFYIGDHNPYRVSFNNKEVSAFVANIHRAGRHDPDEFRIQCPGDLPSRLAASKSQQKTVLILGYHAGSDVFSAWDPELFLRRSTRVQRFSIYTRLSRIRQANRAGFARYLDTEGQVVLLFRSEYLGLYIENTEIIHRATERALKNIVDAYGHIRLGDRPQRHITIARRKITVTHHQYPRTRKFRTMVLSAYGNRCAMCGMQLELVEAAHLVPHAHPEGTDAIGNGLALCSIHHKSLDTGLIYLDDDYSILMNDVRVAYLRKLKLVEGLKRYKRNLRPSLALPRAVSQYPRRTNILLAKQLRGIDVV